MIFSRPNIIDVAFNVPAITVSLNAANTSSITGTTNVAEWRDTSGNRFNPLQASGTKQPAYTANLQAGRHGIVCDGTDDVLVTSSNSTFMEPGTGYMSIFVVSKVLSGTYSVGKGRLNNTTGAGGWAHSTTSGSRLLAGTSAPADISGSTVYTLPQDSPTLKEWEFDGANLTYYDNGVQFGTTKTYSGSISTTRELAIGGRVVNDNYSAQQMFEIVLCKSALTSDQLLSFRRYFANGWGFSIS